jgi:hypothetical protein
MKDLREQIKIIEAKSYTPTPHKTISPSASIRVHLRPSSLLLNPEPGTQNPKHLQNPQQFPKLT